MQPEELDPDEARNTADAAVAALLAIEGAMCAAVVDSDSGMVLSQCGSGMDVDLAAACHTEVVRAMRRTLTWLDLDDGIEDVLVTLTSQYHILRPVAAYPNVFILLVLDRARSDLGMARIKLRAADITEGWLS
ncbi:hypothetical protein FJ656_07240 [Schumannella luteola]|nr:hypothetical protein FJ656_07240 [Schumannella luteola]